MPLKYPLNCYDESGRLKPPVFIYLLMLFVCRGLVILIISLSFREDSERLLRLFYPQAYHFYLSLIPIVPALITLIWVSRRNKMWANNRHKMFRFMVPLMLLAMWVDAGVQVYMLANINYQFSINHGLSIFFSIAGSIYLVSSQYIKTLVLDWQTP